jgi:hypothetical protein
MEIVRKYTWGIDDYCYIRYDNGTSITLSKLIGVFTTDQQWLDLAQWYWDQTQVLPPDPMVSVLMSCSDAMLVDEVIRRHLIVTVQQGPPEE